MVDFKPDRNCWRITGSEEFEVLINGEAYFRDVHEKLLSARKSVYIMGWDIDFRIHLLRGPSGRDAIRRGRPVRFGAVLKKIARDNPSLRICLLIWDHPIIYNKDREWFSGTKARIFLPNNVHFFRDSDHPLMASHHEKLVVIDDEIAYCGGMDLSGGRWDRISHPFEEPNRIDPGWGRYSPFRDVMVRVRGETAFVLSEHFRDRWNQLDRTVPKIPEPQSMPPPPGPLKVAISRTRPEYGVRKEIREIEHLYLDIIRSSKKLLLIENQYLASEKISKALCERLCDPDGPYIFIVVAGHKMDFLEDISMGTSLKMRLQELETADQFSRLAVYSPYRKNGTETRLIKIHSKVMMSDFQYMSIGSANLNDRSFGLDTELNLTLDCENSQHARTLIERASLRLAKSVIGTRLNLKSHPNSREFGHELRAYLSQLPTLRPLIKGPPTEVERWVQETFPTDMGTLLPFEAKGRKIIRIDRAFWMKFVLRAFFTTTLILSIALVAYLYQRGEIAHIFNLDLYREKFAAFQPTKTLGAILTVLYILLGSLFFPLNLFILIVASLFPAGLAFFYILVGAMGTAIFSHWMGRSLGSRLLRSKIPKTYRRVSLFLEAKGFLTIAAMRMVPIAPYSLVNLICGALRVRMRPYLGGTLLGILPGAIGLVAFQKSLISFITGPDLLSALILALVLIGFVLFARNLKQRVDQVHEN